VGDGPHHLVTGDDAEAVQELMEGAQLSEAGAATVAATRTRKPSSIANRIPASVLAQLPARDAHRAAPASPNRG
jgi:hypothetical protein